MLDQTLRNGTVSLKEKMQSIEKELILDALRDANGNISEAARSLKVPVQTLYSKVQKYGISLEVVVLSQI